MDLHPYDGVERRFQHSDPDQRGGLQAVAQLLHLPQPPECGKVCYDLSFYSGGIGVQDNLAITLPADATTWANVATALRAISPEDAAQADDFLFLLAGEHKTASPRQAAVMFINARRRTFQPECLARHCILFSQNSDVNSWLVLWGDDTVLNYLAYDQG